MCGNHDSKPDWWYMPAIPALRRLRQEDHKFSDSLGYTKDPVSTNKQKP
jgi:hypothetical protein